MGEIEGWLSLGLLAVLFLIPALPRLTRETFVTLFAGTFGVASMFALSGVRFGRGPGRMAGAITLVVLLLIYAGIAAYALSIRN